MSEVEAVETPQEALPEVTADPAEEVARSKGWISEEEWKANPDNEGKEWRSAREFNLYGELVGEIRSMRATMRETMDAQAKAIRKELESKYKREFDAAVDEGDKVKAAQARDELEKLKEPAQPPVDNVAVEEFLSRNKWFNREATDEIEQEMTAVALGLDNELHSKGQLSTKAILERVERRIKELYPSKFANPARSRPQAVETGGRISRPGKRSLPSLDSLGPEFQNVGRKQVRQGVFKSESEYVQSLVDTGVLDV